MNFTPATQVHNIDVLAAVPLGILKLMEVGTGSGALAREIIAKCGDIEYIGVELCEQYAKMSEQYCKKIYIENFENPSGELLRELENTDVIIFADVLEHFSDPWAVLKRIHSWMNCNGKIIACIPNVQHWSIQLGLLAGNFMYNESGLLDRTHLRFFTRSTLIQMFESCGFSVRSISPRIFKFPGQDEALDNLKTFAEMNGLDPIKCVRDAAAFQYVIEAHLS